MRAGQKVTPEQRERMRAAHNRPEVKKRHIRAAKEVQNRPEVKEKIRKAQKVRFSDPEVREERSKAAKEVWSRPGYKERQSEAQKEAHNRPEVRERMSKAAKEVCASPEVRERMSKAAKESWSNFDFRINQSRIIKEACARPEIKERKKEAMNRPEVKERLSKATKERMAKPENRKIISEALAGSKSSNWKGGISFEPYCHKFNRQLKDEIRAAFGYKCYLCPHIQNSRKLSIHHVDYDKNDICNGKKWPLIPLCIKCHAKTNFNRWYWFNLLMNYWAMNPEINFSSLATVPASPFSAPACEQA